MKPTKPVNQVATRQSPGRRWISLLACIPLMLSFALTSPTVFGADPAPGDRTLLGVEDGHFTLNNQPGFLLGVSYYGALGAPEDFIRKDLIEFRARGFNWLRVWATWGAYDTNVSAVTATGLPREPYLTRLRWLVAECDRLGMVVDVTLTRGKELPDFGAHLAAVDALVAALKSFRNWYLDLGNERDVGDARYVSLAELKELREKVRILDPQRLVTASFGGHDLSQSDVRGALEEVSLDFLCPHRPRHRKSPGETEAETRSTLRLMKEVGRILPVHYQEPFRRGYTAWDPVATDFLTDLRGALSGGAAGWCFHNGGQRTKPDEQPRRSFDLRSKRLIEQLDEEEIKVVRSVNSVLLEHQQTRTQSAATAKWRITTFAGTGEKGFSGDGEPATQAQLNNPFGVVRGPDGGIYFCDTANHRIRKIGADGKISTAAGSGRPGFSGDGGPALQAELNEPYEIRFDKAGNLFFVEMSNHLVRRVDARTRIIFTVAGNGKEGFSGDGGPATNATFKQPHSIQFAPNGDLYICDIGNHRIRKVNMKTRIVTTFAGNGKPEPTPDAARIEGTPLNGPRAIDFDRDGNLWLALREGNQVYKFDLKTGTIHHVAGTGKKGFTGNGGPPKQSTLSGPKGLAVAPNGNVYFADSESHSIRMIDLKKGTLELVAGTGELGDGPDGDPLKCRMTRPHGIFVDSDGSIFIGDTETQRVRVMRPVR